MPLQRLRTRTGRRRLARLGVAAAALLVVVTGCAGPSGPSASGASRSVDLRGELRSLAGRLVDEGMTGAIVRVDDGHAVVQFTVGLSDLSQRRDLQVGDESRVGSITKTFVAVLVLQ